MQEWLCYMYYIKSFHIPVQINLLRLMYFCRNEFPTLCLLHVETMLHRVYDCIYCFMWKRAVQISLYNTTLSYGRISTFRTFNNHNKINVLFEHFKMYLIFFAIELSLYIKNPPSATTLYSLKTKSKPSHLNSWRRNYRRVYFEPKFGTNNVNLDLESRFTVDWTSNQWGTSRFCIWWISILQLRCQI